MTEHTASDSNLEQCMWKKTTPHDATPRESFSIRNKFLVCCLIHERLKLLHIPNLQFEEPSCKHIHHVEYCAYSDKSDMSKQSDSRSTALTGTSKSRLADHGEHVKLPLSQWSLLVFIFASIFTPPPLYTPDHIYVASSHDTSILKFQSNSNFNT